MLAVFCNEYEIRSTSKNVFIMLRPPNTLKIHSPPTTAKLASQIRVIADGMV